MEKKENGWKLGTLRDVAGKGYNIIYHRCQWNIDPGVNYISGSITSYFKPIYSASGFSEIDFDLTDNMVVDSVKYHATSLTYSQLSDILAITLPSVIAEGVLDSVTVYYQGAPAGSGLGSFVQSTHDEIPIIWTMSEPFGARDWWPCKQSLNDKIDSIDIYVTCPQANRVGTNGVLVSETQNGSNKTYHWKSNYPIATYLVAVAVSEYSQYSDYAIMSNGDSLQVLNYVYAEDLAMAQSLTPAIVPILELFGSLTIDYPFKKEKYGHCEFGYSGGMEHQTMSYTGIFDEWLTAHECAHQWFGDKVTCGSWEDIWLNEGFATYFEGLTHEYLYPGEWADWKNSVRYYIVSLPDGSVLCDDTTDVDRIFDDRLSYCKGAYLLHMLRWELGDAIFFEGVKEYLNDPALAYGYAKTPDLIQHFETVSGKDLTTFFNQWYYKQGYPSYHIPWYPAGNSVNLTMDQSQSHSSVAFFKMHVPLEFKNATHDTIVVVNNTFAGQTFTINLGFIATQLILDPDAWILHANDNTTLLLLPIGLLSFTAQKAGDKTVKLDWECASEINNHYFTIEKSKGETDFATLDTVEGAGTSEIPLSYIAYDDHPYKGMNYYRLKQTDYNGDIKYSQIVNVDFSDDTYFFVYPNPANDDLNIVSGQAIEQIVIMDVTGRHVYEQRENFNKEIRISLSGIAPGCYLLKTVNSMGEEKSQILIKGER
ncbi:MAG TPA: M1 family aminopeptidase [Chitinophagales bacterium]|nr:M1 family aminopeptidase [Chitinophagales bacterium]